MTHLPFFLRSHEHAVFGDVRTYVKTANNHPENRSVLAPAEYEVLLASSDWLTYVQVLRDRPSVGAGRGTRGTR